MYLLGIDLGSSAIKVAIISAETCKCMASASSPSTELEIIANNPGWAEQEPEVWWQHTVLAIKMTLEKAEISGQDISAIGIAYQMHGLVVIDKQLKLLRPAIIWCDSRAVGIGEKALNDLGSDFCLTNLLNSPGNFTASKLKWIKDNEPTIYQKIYKIMLPGDYLAFKLTGHIQTTETGLSEGIFWDFKKHAISDDLLNYYGIDKDLLPEICPVFSKQAVISSECAKLLGLNSKAVVAYRAGDQPNNALSLNVLKAGEVAATAGTSGVIYGVSQTSEHDKQSRVNTFVHVNSTNQAPLQGVLLCVNGTGILYSWIKNKILGKNSAHNLSYQQMNQLASQAPIGSVGLSILPYGNGAERSLSNKTIGAEFSKIDFNIHDLSHIIRATQEGIVFALYYGLEIMRTVGVIPTKIRAGHANMFLSDVFSSTLSTLSTTTIELYDTDGAQGAARGAGYGAGFYSSLEHAFAGLNKLKTIEPDTQNRSKTHEAYSKWLGQLEKNL